MPSASPPTEPQPAPPVRTAVILGADAVLAVRPATPLQLVHACFAAGYAIVAPASWGDELLAKACLDHLAAAKDDRPAVLCACPRLAGRLPLEDAEVRASLLPLVPPPVAAARYLRALVGEALRITYVGGCEGAADDSIDIHLSPRNLLTLFDHLGISVRDQSEVFDSMLAADWRRHFSLPGGLPTPEWLWRCGEREVAELDVASLPAHVREARRTVVDLAPRVGCSCIGASDGVPAARARAALEALEPERSPEPIVNTAIPVTLAPSISSPEPEETATAAPESEEPQQPEATAPEESQVAAEVAPAAGADEPPPAAEEAPREPAAPERLLPRTYLARRRRRAAAEVEEAEQTPTLTPTPTRTQTPTPVPEASPEPPGAEPDAETESVSESVLDTPPVQDIAPATVIEEIPAPATDTAVDDAVEVEAVIVGAVEEPATRSVALVHVRRVPSTVARGGALALPEPLPIPPPRRRGRARLLAGALVLLAVAIGAGALLRATGG
ncbi:MAG TPA: hypothetical protein VFS05_10740, partial [Gemmatimonadaceae bacterium]|nr:hypothetical protein [Gemmatimonadaceae bacterium]